MADQRNRKPMTELGEKQSPMIGPPDLGFTTVTLKTLIDERTVYESRLLEERTKRYDERAAADARLSAERDRRYAERADAAKEAVAAALVAQKELLAAALASSKEAVSKQETSTAQLFAALTEKIETLGKDLGGRIELLAKARDQGEGKGAGLQAGWQILIAGAGLVLTLLLIGGAILAFAP